MDFNPAYWTATSELPSPNSSVSRQPFHNNCAATTTKWRMATRDEAPSLVGYGTKANFAGISRVRLHRWWYLNITLGYCFSVWLLVQLFLHNGNLVQVCVESGNIYVMECKEERHICENNTSVVLSKITVIRPYSLQITFTCICTSLILIHKSPFSYFQWLNKICN